MNSNRFPPSPVAVRHAEPSMVLSADDETSVSTDWLFDVALQSAKAAKDISLSEISSRMNRQPYFPDIWPGEHYKLLAGIVKILAPKRVLEIGTFTGLSALSLKAHLPADGKIITFDIEPWESFSDTVLKSEDFDHQLEQQIADMADPKFYIQNRLAFLEADLIFVDGPKDAATESIFIKSMEMLSLEKAPLIIFDDIRLWNMLEIWRNIKKPKLDLTSFGHWSGTGLVHWTSN